MTAIPKAQVKYWGSPSVRFSAPSAVGTSGQYLQTQADGTTDWATVDLSGYVPYTGASSAVDLGTQVLSAGTAKLGLGSMAAPSLSFSSDTDTGIYNQYGDQLRLVIGGSDRLAITTAVIASYLPVRTDVIYGINNVVDFRNSTNPQAFRLANTYTSSTNYEALQFKANTTQYEISSIVGSAGGSNRALAFGHTNAAGTFTNVFSIDVASNPLLTIASNYTLIATTMQIQSGGQLRGVSGNITLSDHATASTFNLLRFGGTSSSFPAIKRNSTELDFRLADDSAYCNINANGASFANDVTVTGHFSATTKSFLIDHPSKPGKKLQYASLEGPENGVYVRGTADSPTIVLPDYWADLIHEDSITVSLTPLDEFQPLFVRAKSSRAIEVGGSTGRYDYVIYGERKDVAKLEVELWA